MWWTAPHISQSGYQSGYHPRPGGCSVGDPKGAGPRQDPGHSRGARSRWPGAGSPQVQLLSWVLGPRGLSRAGRRPLDVWAGAGRPPWAGLALAEDLPTAPSLPRRWGRTPYLPASEATLVAGSHLLALKPSTPAQSRSWRGGFYSGQEAPFSVRAALPPWCADAAGGRALLPGGARLRARRLVDGPRPVPSPRAAEWGPTLT